VKVKDALRADFMRGVEAYPRLKFCGDTVKANVAFNVADLLK
jgi:hypothetical protein